ncbi:hypothetical protein MAXJ12_23367 [Mesorhizobium alhagi CCNWXJ12-2]|uniref:Uncharacterized protein n=1 Tax=Mesorhizobium alhagi CCNWXJ12-2 TaxID=1107882 RepID=H0HWS4_9HYPH|nr:hypothetical protein MAXJ12_23367 [Mesorhizobium alhagi CCNWXJ12-2]
MTHKAQIGIAGAAWSGAEIASVRAPAGRDALDEAPESIPAKLSAIGDRGPACNREGGRR